MRLARLVTAAAVSLAVALVPAAAGDLDPVLGRAIFKRMWVAGGASTRSADGLGPLFNARSCTGCHRDAGPSQIVALEDGTLEGAGLIVRLSNPDGGPDPVYGRQIEPQALAGQTAEAKTAFNLVPPAPGEPGPHTAVVLSAFGYGPLAPATTFGVRAGPSLRGRAALDRIDEAAVAALADPDDANSDGISGREQRLDDGSRGTVLGRYGWRAGHATLETQIAGAFSLDIGLSTPLYPNPAGDCTPAQKDCLAARHGDRDGMTETEVTGEMLAMLEAYLASIKARPPAADSAPGRALFVATGCGACHVPEMPAVGGGTVPAFTDLLLHDLGPGLADPAVEGVATAAEWRTAPLVGLGDGRPGARRFLHDGRAGSIDEAIRWHGGEASAAKMRYEDLSAADRAALVAYLKGL